MEPANGLARRAEEDRRLRLMEAKQVDDGMLDVRRRHCDRLIGNVLVPLIVAKGLNPQRILLIALG